MIETTATIVSKHDGFSLVQLDESGCGRCNEPGGCGGQVNLSRIFCSPRKSFRVIDSGAAAAGDRVTIVIPEGRIFRSALLAYIVPLAGLFLGAAAGFFIGQETGAIVGAVSGLIAAWVIPVLFHSRSVSRQENLPHVKY